MKKFIVILLVSIFSFSFAQAEDTYTYYYGQWCSHCAKVDKYLNAVDWYEKLWIDKKEIYFDADNRAAMQEDAKRLWLGEDWEWVWVPFFIVNNDWVETPIIWDATIIEYFTPILGEAPKSNAWIVILIILALLAIAIPTFLIKWSNKK